MEQIRGPWRISMRGMSGQITNFTDISMPSGSTYVRITPDQGYYFIIDDVRLVDSRVHAFSYTVQYVGTQTMRIALEDTNDDTYTDIKLMPIDGCTQYFWQMLNTRSLV